MSVTTKEIKLRPVDIQILVLCEDSAHNQTQLRKKLKKSARTIRHSLDKLQGAGMINKQPDLWDLRGFLYTRV